MLTSMLGDPNEHVRVWAIRLLTDDWRLDDMSGRVRMTTWDDAHEQLVQRFIVLAKSDPWVSCNSRFHRRCNVCP